MGHPWITIQTMRELLLAILFNGQVSWQEQETETGCAVPSSQQEHQAHSSGYHSSVYSFNFSFNSVTNIKATIYQILKQKQIKSHQSQPKKKICVEIIRKGMLASTVMLPEAFPEAALNISLSLSLSLSHTHTHTHTSWRT